MNISLSVPVHSLIHPLTARAVNETAERLRAEGHRVGLSFLSQESLISRARDTVAAHFLGSLNDVLVSIDADMVFRPDDVLALLAHNVPFACANYMSKAGRPMLAVRGDGLVPIETVALGLVALRRDAFEDVIRARERDPAFVLDYYPHAQIPCVWGFHVPFVHDGRYLSDAAALAHRLRRARVPLYADTRLGVGHVTRAVRYLAEGRTP